MEPSFPATRFGHRCPVTNCNFKKDKPHHKEGKANAMQIREHSIILENVPMEDTNSFTKLGSAIATMEGPREA